MKNKYETHGKLTIIHAECKGKDMVTFIDTEDLEKISDGTISIYETVTNKFYADIIMNNKKTALHRFLMGLEKGDKREVDHKNNSGLDNRRSSNLRICTHCENMQNRRTFKKKIGSGKINITYDARIGKWKVRITKNRKAIYGGSFYDYKIAEQVAVELRKEYFPFSKEAAS